MSVYLCTSAIIFVVLWQCAVGEEQCGKFNEAQLYNEKPVTGINEFPWIGRIYYREYETNKREFRCAAVLINKRNLLTAYHCVERNYYAEPEYVLLGDYDYGNPDTEQDCDTKNKCAPVAKPYMIRDVILHPNYNKEKRLNDIAILHLETDVEYNDYVQPICMPPPTLYEDALLTEYFPLAGYLYRHPFINSLNSTKKVKTVAHVISNVRCSHTFKEMSSRPPQLDSSVICTSFFSEYTFLSGSILMAVNIVDSKLSNFFLLGILSYGGTDVEDDNTVQYHVFMKISANTNWIQSNINQPYYKKF